MGKEEDAAFIVSSNNRMKVIRRLAEGDAIPKQIRADTGLEYSRVSESLNSLEERGLVELLVSDDMKRGRMRSLTDRGEEAVEYMHEQNMLD